MVNLKRAKWELNEEKLVVVTTENARSMVNATELLHWQHFGCFAHTLQLGVKKVMELTPISKALGRGWNLVIHIISSYVLTLGDTLVHKPHAKKKFLNDYEKYK